MFTGIIEELGRVREVEKRGDDARIVIEARTVTEGALDGDSIAVNGVCLTALEVQPDCPIHLPQMFPKRRFFVRRSEACIRARR